MPVELHFIRPYWFLALIPLTGCIWYLARQKLVNRHWESVCDPALLPYILVGRTGVRSYRDIALIGSIFLITIMALAGPAWEKLPQPVFQKESALVIALDLSYSMYADDIKPSRLERARFEISDLLDLRKEGQTALIAYAGDAFTVTPLTNDTQTIKSQLTALSPEIMPAPGSNIELTLKKAQELLKQAGQSLGHVLLITDEIDDKYKSHIKDLKSDGYKVSILGIGTKEGAPVKLADGTLLEDRTGSIVIPKLEVRSLQKLARAGGGLYESSQINDRDIEQLNQFFNKGVSADNKTESDFDTDQWHEFGPWLVLLIIPFMALVFRKGYLSFLLCFFIVQPDDVLALDWNELWFNKDQLGMRALENKENEKASELFENRDWKAAAKYKAGDYSATERLLQDAEDKRSLYNKGNALAKQGRYEEAIAMYDKVLNKDAEHEDAKFNKELLEKELEKKQQGQSKKPEQTNEGTDKNENDDGFESDYNLQRSGSHGESGQKGDGQSEKSEEMSDGGKQGGEKNSDNDEQDNIKEQKTDEEEGENKQQPSMQAQSNEVDEEKQASEQWLRRIPDDPSGLLRRKFKYQYQQQSRRTTTDKYW